MSCKVYVEVDASFSPEGQVLPRVIHWQDGSLFPVDRVLDIRQAAATRAGGCGIRYTCRIRGQMAYLFLEENRWFVEQKDGTA